MKNLLNIVNGISNPASQIRFAPYGQRELFRVLQDNILCRNEISRRKQALDRIVSEQICDIDDDRDMPSLRPMEIVSTCQGQLMRAELY